MAGSASPTRITSCCRGRSSSRCLTSGKPRTVIHDRNEGKADGRSKIAMLLVADAIGLVLMFFVLFQGHKLVAAKEKIHDAEGQSASD